MGRENAARADRTARRRIRWRIQMGEIAQRLQQLLILLVLQIVHCLHVRVGQLLNLIERALLIVLGNLVVLEHLLEPVVGVTPDRADVVAALFGHLVDVPRQLFAALVGQRRDGNAQHLAVAGRIEAEVGQTNRPLERRHQRWIERLRHDQRRLGNRERGHLVEGHLRAIRLDVHVLEQSGRRAPGAHARQFLPHEFDLRVHALLHFAEQPLSRIHP